MIRSNTSLARTPPRNRIQHRLWRRKLLLLARHRLSANLLALVALISIGFV